MRRPRGKAGAMRPGAEISGACSAALAAIRLEFPGWHPWCSSAGRFWATRISRRRQPPDAPAAWAMTIDADTPGELRDALAAQEQLAPESTAPG